MPAPNIPDLFDFETHYENAVSNYYASINGNPFNQIVTPRTNLNVEGGLETPRLEVRLAITGTGIQEYPIPNSAVRFRPHKTASLTLRVATNRDNTSQPHGLLRGYARQGMLEVTAALNANTLPYYQTVFVVESGSIQGIADVNDEIVTDLTYAIEFAVQSSQWPNA